MTIAVEPAEREAEAPTRLLWTVREFERAAKRGAFERPERLELVNGEIYQKMTQNGPHATATTLCAQAAQALCAASGDTVHVRVQMPLTLGETSAPEPDVAIVAGGARDYVENHPVTALLVIEVSDATLAFDQGVKASVYARAGVAEFWIVNLRDRTLIVHRDPAADRNLTRGYESVSVHQPGAVITPLLAPNAPVAVADLLP